MVTESFKAFEALEGNCSTIEIMLRKEITNQLETFGLTVLAVVDRLRKIEIDLIKKESNNYIPLSE